MLVDSLPCFEAGISVSVLPFLAPVCAHRSDGAPTQAVCGNAVAEMQGFFEAGVVKLSVRHGIQTPKHRTGDGRFQNLISL